MQKNSGLARVKEFYQDRGKRARALKSKGQKILGYFCCFPPLEVMTAANLTPYRVVGDLREPITKADACIEAVACGYVRNCLDGGLKGRYDFLDGLVFPHACETIQSLYDIWKYYLKPAYCYFLNVPTVVSPTSQTFFKAEIEFFKESVERLIGGEISKDDMRGAIRLYNENRALLKELAWLKREDPPLISGIEMAETALVTMSIPVAEANELLRGVTKEVKNRKRHPEGKKARLLVYGGPIDDISFVKLLEDSGARVVMDDLCFGTRYYWDEVEMTEDPLEGLAARYLDKIRCPRTFRGKDRDFKYEYLLEYARDFHVDGVVFYVLKYCEGFPFDVPIIRDYLQEAGLPVLHIEDDYTMASIGGLKTRIEAFLEMIGQ